MVEFIVHIAPEKEHLIKMLVEELGGEVIEEKTKDAAKKEKKSGAKKQGKIKEVSPTFLFGKWKDLDIDARKLRDQAWGRSHKSL
jgi:hypothetical protein